MQFTVQISMSNHLQAKVMLLGAPTNSSSGSFSGLHEPISVDIDSLAVLVVDDDADSRAILRTWFELWGLKVREAAHAAEAIERMFEQPACRHHDAGSRRVVVGGAHSPAMAAHGDRDGVGHE